MTDRPAIVAEHLTKVYRLYDRPQQRALDLMGLRRRGRYTEHYALDDVSLSVRRGERVGLIGRNGAGKSTFLKVVSGVTPPTSGSVYVDGQARALLEIGTGFHPDFTGRDNAKAYFAQLGIAGRQAQALIDEVIDFSELEEYIDQPIKTYSTGMRMRLMFATATVLVPDILVLDEVLGVGDAYFTAKSFERIREMAQRDGATLLLVSHDVYTSARICERMVWLEKGRVVFDGDPPDAVKAYEDSIRQQEEARLRAKANFAIERAQPTTAARRRPLGPVQFEVATPDGRPLPTPVWFRSVRLSVGGQPAASLPLLADEGPGARLDFEGTCWGTAGEWQGAPARPMQVFGSPFHRVAGIFAPLEATAADGASIAVEWGADYQVEVLVSCRIGDQLAARRHLAVGGQVWERTVVDLGSPAMPGRIEPAGDRAAVFGTGRLRIGNVRLLDAEGNETFAFWHGGPFRLSFDYEIQDPSFDEYPDIVVAILRGGVDTACRALTRSLRLSYGDSPTGRIELKLDELLLGSGNYSASVLIARHRYYEGHGHLFYTVNPDVHVCIRDLIDFSVKAHTILADGTAWVAQGSWQARPIEPAPQQKPQAVLFEDAEH